MSKDDINEVTPLLNQWLEYGDIKELADKYLIGKRFQSGYKYQYASKVKNGKLRNTTFLVKLIERAIYRKSLIESQLQKLRA